MANSGGKFRWQISRNFRPLHPIPMLRRRPGVKGAGDGREEQEKRKNSGRDEIPFTGGAFSKKPLCPPPPGLGPRRTWLKRGEGEDWCEGWGELRFPGGGMHRHPGGSPLGVYVLAPFPRMPSRPADCSGRRPADNLPVESQGIFYLFTKFPNIHWFGNIAIGP